MKTCQYLLINEQLFVSERACTIKGTSVNGAG